MGQLILWWLLIEVMTLVGLPFAFRIFSPRLDHGYAFAKLITALVVTYVAWILGHLGIGYPTALTIAIVLFVAVSAGLAWSGREALSGWLRADGRRAIAVHEGLWAFGFLFFAWQRSLGPEIIGAEKYMDFAFYNNLARTDVMPPQDPWMSGEIYNYYYFGYLVLANLGRLVPMPMFISYNFCVATLGGLAFALPSAVGLALTRSLPFGILSGVMTALIGNLDGFLQYWEKGSWTAFDYWRSTRIVGGDSTINEFPYFTIIHGDVHPHFIVLPVAVMLWALLADPERRPSAPAALSSWRDVLFYLPIAFVFGCSVAISPWELPVSGLMTFLLLQRDVPLWPLISWPRLRAGLASVVILVVGYVLFLPFYSHFTAPPGGVGVKFATTSLGQFLIVFGALLAPPALYFAAQAMQTSVLAIRREVLHVLLALALLAMLVVTVAGSGSVNLVFFVLVALAAGALVSLHRADSSEQRIASLLALGAVLALLACEIVYIKDAYGDRLYRMNTVFKLYFQAWILLVLAGPWCWMQLVRGPRVSAGMRNAAIGVVAALLLASVAYPYGITMTRLSHRGGPATLDGNEYLRREHPGDWAAIEWLRQNVRDMPVILEASGDPYSYYARFASNVGIPTVMGWSNHEGLWRAHELAVGQRRTDVTKMYSDRSLDQVTSLLDRYQVKYIVVGELERKDYPADGLAKFSALNPVFKSGDTVIYER